MLFFFNDTATTEIYTLSLHDALPICKATIFPDEVSPYGKEEDMLMELVNFKDEKIEPTRSEEHTSELQSRQYLVCRLLLEKKKKKRKTKNEKRKRKRKKRKRTGRASIRKDRDQT